MEGFASSFSEANIVFVGKVARYFESGKVDAEVYYDKGVLKQMIDYDKGGYSKVGLYNGQNIPIYVTSNHGKIVEIKYSENGFIKFLKWDFTMIKKG